MGVVLGIGECMVELSGAGDGLWRQGFAGDVLNTLWYCRAALPAAWRVQFHTAVGTDPISEQMLAFIAAADIDCSDVPRIERRLPGLYAIHLDGAERSFSYWRETSAARLLMAAPEMLRAKAAAADLIYLSGITLAILPPDAADALVVGLRTWLKPGARLAFDPNIRPHLWDDEDRMKATISAAAAAADIVLPSFDDEVRTFHDADPEATARRYRSLGAAQVVVKNGSDATLLVDEGGLRRIDVPPISGVIDTTAAGDSFNGAFLAGLLQTGDAIRAVRAAQICAGKVVCTKGALVPFDDLDRRETA